MVKKYIDEDTLEAIVQEVKHSLYPIGSIYTSTSAATPETVLGFGTWEQIKDVFLLSAGNTYKAGTKGGEATHKLTVDEVAFHTHKPTTKLPGGDTYNEYAFTINRHYSSDAVQRFKVNGGSEYTVMGTKLSAPDCLANKDIEQSLETAPAGGNSAHNNMPPYLVVYIWKRVS